MAAKRTTTTPDPFTSAPGDTCGGNERKKTPQRPINDPKSVDWNRLREGDAAQWKADVGFRDIPDPRQAAKVRYPLPHLCALIVAAMAAEFDSFEAMALWAHHHGEALLERLDLSPLPAMPSHDTFRHFLSLLDPGHLDALVRRSLRLAGKDTLEGQLVLIDGKALRGTWGPKADPAGHLTVLNAHAPDLRLSLGSVPVAADTNESAQLPGLIQSLSLEGATVCIDAAGCQKTVADAITGKKAHYILTLKDNQPKLHDAVHTFFDTALGAGAAPQGDLRTATHQSASKGRQLQVTLHATTWLDWLDTKDDWRGLTTVARLQRRRVDEHGTVHETTVHLLSSLSDPHAILAGALGRWAIENTLHWTLDVTWGEDRCRTRERNAALNLAALRRLADNLHRLHPARLSMKMKRRLAATSHTFLLDTLKPLLVHA